MKRIIVLLLLSLMLMPNLGLASTRTQLEKEIHIDAWLEVATRAAYAPEYKYAIYASRSLVVKNPEFYLQGDGIFNRLLTTGANMRLYYEERNPNPSIREQRYREIAVMRSKRANRFDWDDFDITKHQLIDYQDIYGAESFLPFVDIRLYHLGTALLGWNYQAPPLSMAQFVYFRFQGDRNFRNPYLAVTGDGTGYVAANHRRDGLQLYNYHGEAMTTAPDNIILVFDDKSVWYPLMERDDTGKDRNLRAVVDTFTTENNLPMLTAAEEEIVRLLRDNTLLGTRMEQQWGLVAASKLHTRSWPTQKELRVLYPPWRDKVNTSHGPEVLIYELSLLHRIGNRLNPATAKLASGLVDIKHMEINDVLVRSAGTRTFQLGMERLSQEYFLSLNGTDSNRRPLYPWWYHSEINFRNMDDVYLARTANCISTTTNLAAVIDIARIPGYEATQVFIPGHVVLLVTGPTTDEWGIFDNARWMWKDLQVNRVILRGMGFADDWICFVGPNDHILALYSEWPKVGTTKIRNPLSMGFFDS